MYSLHLIELYLNAKIKALVSECIIKAEKEHVNDLLHLVRITQYIIYLVGKKSVRK